MSKVVKAKSKKKHREECNNETEIHNNKTSHIPESVATKSSNISPILLTAPINLGLGDYDSDDSDCGYGASSHPPTSYGGSSHAPTEENGEGRWSERDAGDAASLSQSWRWPRWKKNQLKLLNL